MENRKPLFLIALCVGVLFLLGNTFVQKMLDENIRKNKLIDEQFLDGAPPLVAFSTQALGGFRGLIADGLWLRAINMQEKGRYFEMVQLASWIMKLQPKSTATAAYLGWNMAYNISVTYSRKEDRWRWVNKGIELYHEALNYNPNDPTLYKELGWIYQHKLGNILDDAQRYYKYQIAMEMLKIMGVHYPDWKRLSAAPRTLAAFRKTLPQNSNFLKILQECNYDSLEQLSREFRSSGGLFPARLEARLDKELCGKLIDTLRVSWLKDRFGLDPSYVVQVEKLYGELDWYLPESFAIYWAHLGIDRSPNRENLDCERMITQALHVIFTNGRMLFVGKTPNEDFLLVPNLSVVDAAVASYDKAVKNNPNVLSFIHARENFITRAIASLYSFGQYSKAREYYEKIQKISQTTGARRLSFDAFVIRAWEEEVRDAGYKQAQDFISGLIVRACILLGYGDYTAAAGHLRLGEMIYKEFTTRMDVERLKLPPYAQMKAEIAKSIMESVSPEMAARIRGQIAADALKGDSRVDQSKMPQKITLPLAPGADKTVNK